MDSQDDLLVMEKDRIGNCSRDAMHQFSLLLNPIMLMRANMLTCLVVIFVGIFVIGLYKSRYQYRSFFRFIFLGASTLFLPILSYIASNGTTMVSTPDKRPRVDMFYQSSSDSLLSYEIMTLDCNADLHLFLIILLVVLAELVVINTNIIIVADDREGRNDGLPVVLIAKTMWTWYLAVAANVFAHDKTLVLRFAFGIVFMKVVLKCSAFWLARLSLAYGRNPRFIVGYMMQKSKQLGSNSDKHGGITYDQSLPPPLIVMGEERQKISKQPHGYEPLPNKYEETLVTIDKVWRLDDKLMKLMPQIKDVCFSVALFKLLRCRFAGYTVIEAGFTQVHNFFWHELMLKDNAERVFTVIEDELSLLHDYYHTTLPVSSSKNWLQMANITVSLYTIWYFMYSAFDMVYLVKFVELHGRPGQIYCTIGCFDSSQINLWDSELSQETIKFGSIYLDIGLVFILLALVFFAEARHIYPYIFSIWTEVNHICIHVVQQNTRQNVIYKCDSTVSKLIRWCSLMKHRMDKMSQCSVLVLRQKYQCITHFRLYFRLGDKSNKVKVPAVVKAAIIKTLKSNNGVSSSGEAFSPRKVQDGGNFIWGFSDKGPAETILICHIATSLLELRHPQSAPASDHENEITATHLSRYCAYLVSHEPQLLPDDNRWCERLYKEVKKNSMHLLSGGVTRYEPLVILLGNPVAHEVLQKGASLAVKLVTEHKSKAWSVLAEFWSEMILQVASSSKIDSHAEAIARGTELITLVWALVMHAGPAPAPAPAPPPDSASAPEPEAGTVVAPSEIGEVWIDIDH